MESLELAHFVGQAFLSILKKSSSSNVENLSMVIVDEDVQAANEEDDNTEGGCRVIVKLFLKHGWSETGSFGLRSDTPRFDATGVTKTHRLTFSPEVALVALANRDACTSEWTASPGVLKQWMVRLELHSMCLLNEAVGALSRHTNRRN